MSKIPTHIAFIVDGNRRWAKKRDLSPFEGHRRGFNKIKQVVKWSFARGVWAVTFYVFSTENWGRSRKEIDYLMDTLFAERLFRRELETLHKNGMRVLVAGERHDLPKKLRERIKRAEGLTKKNTRGTVVFALNYGGRTELVQAVRRILKKKIQPRDVTAELIRQNLYLPQLPDPDIIIRTGGEQRLSNFLMWQSAYSELYFINNYWPDFSERDLEKVLRNYAKRERRFGT